MKYETNDSLNLEQSIPYAIPIFKVDASTSCNDLIYNSCLHLWHEKYFENFVVESCDDLIARDKDELKQEVERLMRDMARLKNMSTKSIVQPS